MAELLERLRERAWRLTSQRRAIAEVFRGPDVHLTAEEVHRRAKIHLPEVSMATVYNTLGELVAMGELKELLHSDGGKRYDPNSHNAHHHLVCDDCGIVLDVELSDVPTLQKRKRRGFDVAAVDVTFRGQCPDCRS